MSVAHTSGAFTGMPPLADEATFPITAGKVRDTAGLKTDELGREELERLVQRVFLSRNGDSPHSVVFCGVDDPNGSATVCARAAQTLAANTCRRICIIEADYKKSDVYRLFGVEACDLDRAAGERVLQRSAQVRSNLWLANSSALGCHDGSAPEAEAVAKSMPHLREEFDYVLINAASAGSHCDAALFGRAADGVILVLEASSTRRKVAQTVAEAIKAADVMLLGAVLNNRTYPIPATLYHRL
jgi:Mrp family chromosome partitioning ATPase